MRVSLEEFTRLVTDVTTQARPEFARGSWHPEDLGAFVEDAVRIVALTLSHPLTTRTNNDNE